MAFITCRQCWFLALMLVVSNLIFLQVGLQASAWVSVGSQIGDEVLVRVEEAHPRDDVLFLKEVVIER